MPPEAEIFVVGRTRNTRRFFLLAAGAVLLCCLVLAPHPARAEGSVTDCTKFGPGEGTLEQALAGGGLVTFECSGVIVIPELKLGLQHLILDGTGQRVTLDGNRANRLFDVGDGDLEIRYLTLTGGKTDLGGGAIFSGGQVTITHSLIYSNVATYGGALEIYNGRILIINSTITDNYATGTGITGGGGAIDQYYQYFAGLDVASKTSLVATGRDRIREGEAPVIVPAGESSPVPDVTVAFSTIVDNNAATGTRAGIWRENGTLTLEGAIIAGNGARDCLLVGNAPFQAKNANMDGDNTCRVTLHGDPRLGPLADYGGSTLVYALKGDSPAVDAAPPGSCLAATDQRRIQRPRAATRDQIAACDLGAYEYARYFYGNSTLSDGIVGHWRFDEGSGAVALDTSGNGNNGTLGSGVAYNADVPPVVFTDHYALESATAGQVAVPNAAILNPVGSMSIAAWVRLNHIDGDVRLVDKVGNLATGPGYKFGVQDGVLRGDFWDTLGAQHTITSGLVVTGTWIHVAVTWSAGGVATTYVNGITAGSQPAGADLAISTGPLRITSPGQIDDVRIYERQLSAAQVGALAGGRSCVETGTTWTDAVPDLQCALTEANGGNTVWVAKGHYVPFHGPDDDASFEIDSGVALYGGFAAGATSLNERDLANNPTVLSGDLLGDDRVDSSGVVTEVAGIVGTNARHVLTLDGVIDTTVVDGFIVTGGSAKGSLSVAETDATTGAGASGAGIYVASGSPLLRRLLLVGNRATDRGGAAYVMSGTPRWVSVVMRSNQAGRGGAFAMDNGQAVIANALIAGNLASDGGGLWLGAGNLRMVNVTVAGNRARNAGGGMALAAGGVESHNGIFAGNEAQDDPQILNAGAAIFTDNRIEDGCPSRASCSRMITGEAGFMAPGSPDDAPTLLGDYSLLPTAVEIDRGQNGAPLVGVLPDIATIGDLADDVAGGARLVAVHQPAKLIDLGAYEAINTPPRFVTFPVQTALSSEPYTYTVHVVDANEPSGAGINLTAPTTPQWMEFEAEGTSAQLTATPPEDSLGKHPIVIAATDPGMTTTKQEFALNVVARNYPMYLPAVQK